MSQNDSKLAQITICRLLDNLETENALFSVEFFTNNVSFAISIFRKNFKSFEAVVPNSRPYLALFTDKLEAERFPTMEKVRDGDFWVDFRRAAPSVCVGFVGFNTNEDPSSFLRQLSQDFIRFEKDHNKVYAYFSKAPRILLLLKSQLISNANRSIYFFFPSKKKCSMCKRIGHTKALCSMNESSNFLALHPPGETVFALNPVRVCTQRTEQKQNAGLQPTGKSLVSFEKARELSSSVAGGRRFSQSNLSRLDKSEARSETPANLKPLIQRDSSPQRTQAFRQLATDAHGEKSSNHSVFFACRSFRLAKKELEKFAGFKSVVNLGDKCVAFFDTDISATAFRTANILGLRVLF